MDSTKITNGRPLAEQVAEHITRHIVEQELEPGTKLPNEFELCELLGVSRSTIREAIKLLVSRKVVEIRRGAGTFVSAGKGVSDDPLGLTFVKDRGHLAMDFLTVRLMIEPQIAGLAAENATEEQIADLIRQCDKVEALIRAKQNHMDEDIQLHTMIAACSGNVVVEKLVPIINSSIEVFVDATKGSLGQETIQTHREIVNAIAEHDAESAIYAMTLHLIYNRRMLKRMEKEQESSDNQ